MSEHVANSYAAELRRLSEHHWGPKLREIADHLEAVVAENKRLEAALRSTNENLWDALNLISKAMEGAK